MKSFVQELQERKVVKTTIGYSVVAFIIMQLVEIIFPIFEFPNWTSNSRFQTMINNNNI